MSNRPRISEEAIKACVGEASFAEGDSSALEPGVVFGARREGRTLRGRVRGRSPEPYRVGVTIDADAIVDSECSCLLGGGCKHVAALLLAWNRSPEAFDEVEPLEIALAHRDKAELIDLIRRMIRRVPALESLLESSSADESGHPAGDPETYRRQAIAAFRLAGDCVRASSDVAADLQEIKVQGDVFLEHGGHTAASVVYEGIVTAIREGYGDVRDEDGEIAECAAECAEGLGCCLDLEDDPARRAAILGSLFGLYRFDLELGGIGIGDEVPGLVIAHAADDEKVRMAGWIRAAIPAGRDRDDHQRRLLGAFLLDLEADTLDDDGYLRICRETGRTLDAIDRLLGLGRADEAETLLDDLPPADRQTAADLFAACGLAASTTSRKQAGPAEL